MISKMFLFVAILSAPISALGQSVCPEVLTRNGVLVSPTKDQMPPQYFLGVDGNDLGHQVVETKKFQLYRDIDDLSVACLQTMNALPSTRVIYESKIIVIYTIYPEFVDYLILVPQTGSDDLVHYRGNRQEHNRREDTLIFQKKSMFDDLQQIIESKQIR